MKLAMEDIDGIRIVSSFPQVLDASSTMEFKAEMGRILEGSTRVVFDMSQVKFIDSAGCGALITSLKQISAAGGALKLYGLQKQVRSVLELVRMHKIIDILNTRQEALRAFSEKP